MVMWFFLPQMSWHSDGDHKRLMLSIEMHRKMKLHYLHAPANAFVLHSFVEMEQVRDVLTAWPSGAHRGEFILPQPGLKGEKILKQLDKSGCPLLFQIIK
jgi:hypothetical protein